MFTQSLLRGMNEVHIVCDSQTALSGWGHSSMSHSGRTRTSDQDWRKGDGERSWDSPMMNTRNVDFLYVALSCLSL
jgi:hypothetical protein